MNFVKIAQDYQQRRAQLYIFSSMKYYLIMYGFFIKKNFCDGWDNIVSLVASNLVTLLVLIGFLWVLTFTAGNAVLFLTVSFIGSMVLHIFILSYSGLAGDIANFNSVSVKDFFLAIPSSVKDGLLLGFFVWFSVTAYVVGIPFYFSQNSMASFLIGGIMIWISVFEFLILQWFVALRALMPEDSFLKILKKCAIITFDNFGFSVFMAVYDFFMLLFSILGLGILPSFSGITLAKTNALRLRLYKYDWLDEHPELRRKRNAVPWEELLQHDVDTLGPRTFKSFVFPWK